MTSHRFYLPEDYSKKTLRIVDPELIRQWTDVLRLEADAEVEFFDGKLNEARAKILDLTPDYVELAVIQTRRNEHEIKTQVTLYCSILKQANFEMVAQKATEVGVWQIVPIISTRTVKLDIREEKVQKIIIEAAEKSGRGIIPALYRPYTLEQALEAAEGNELNIFFDKRGGELKKTKAGRLGIFIGPEGGWEERELAEARAKGAQIANLGSLRLSAETAAIVASYLVCQSL